MYLPSSPSTQERTLFLNPDRIRFYLVSSLSTLFLSIGMMLFVWANPHFIPYSVFAFITIIYLAFSYFVGFFGKDFDFKRHRFLIAKWLDRSDHEEIDVFLPICGEPFSIIKNTWEHVSNLRHVHGGKLHIHVLDDTPSSQFKRLAEDFGFNYINRGSNELKKAGNLRHAFKLTKSPFILILDADFCPSPTFVIDTMPYMYEDPHVAIVQTPQYFEVWPTQTSVQRGAGAIQELFYRLIQVNRDTFGGAICVGTNAIYRRSALEPFGGTAAIPYSEDVRTGFKLLSAGHKIKYIPCILAKGSCPETWKQFFGQQYRWAMGSLSLMLTREFWKAPISLMQRVCYLTGMLYYMATGLSAIFAFLPSIFLLIFKPEYVHWYNMLWALPSIVLTNIYMRFWQKTPFTWSAIEVRAVSYYAHAFALRDILFGKPEEWQASGATIKTKGNFEVFCHLIRLHLGLILFFTVTLSAWRISQGVAFHNLLPLFLLLVYHLLTLKGVSVDLSAKNKHRNYNLS